MKLGVIVLDTLRHDVASNQMEKLWELSDHVFENMYSTSRWTIAAHGSLFTGLYPSEAGTHDSHHYLTLKKHTLAERLSRAGFNTYLCSNNPYIDSFFNFDRGFDTHLRGPACQGRPKTRHGVDWSELFSDVGEGKLKYARAVNKIIRSDAATLPALRTGIEMMLRPTMEEATFETNDVNWLFAGLNKSQLQVDQNLFLYANLMPCHYPYDPPTEYREAEPYNDVDAQKLALDSDLTPEQHERQWGSYKGAARYLDDQLERIVGLCDWDALFIISDHGELFGEHDLRLHNYGVYEELTHIPAVAIGNEIPPGKTPSLTSLLDIHETILRLAGIETDERDRGVDLFTGQEREHVYAESAGITDAYAPDSWNKPYYTFITPRGRITVDKDGTRYELRDSEVESSILESELRSSVNKLRNEWEVASPSESDTEVPDSIGDRLEALGYK